MADISLLFDVARGGSESGDSEALIKSQLQDIVDSINKKPFGIKFEVDSESSKNIKTFLERISKVAAGVKPLDGIADDISKITSASSGGAAKMSAAADGYRDATKAIREYYSYLKQLSTTKTDVVLGANGYESPSGNWKNLATSLNRTKTAFDLVTQSMSNLPADKHAAILQLLAKEQDAYNTAVEKSANKEREAAIAVSERAAKMSAAADAAEESRRKSEADADATDQLNRKYQNTIAIIKEYYDLLTKRAKTPSIEADVYNDPKDDYTWVSESGKYSEFASRLSEVHTAYSQATQSLSAFNEQQRNDITELDAERKLKLKMAVEELSASMDKSKTKILAEESVTKSYNSSVIQCESSLKKWSAAEHSKHASSRVAYQSLKSSIEGAKAAKNAYESGVGSLRDYADAVEKMKAALKPTEAILKANGDATKSFSDRIAGLAEKFGTWFSISSIMMAGYRAIRKMISSVIDLDTAMTELKKVTNETDEAYEKFLTRASARAKELGATLTDTVNATADFARLGYGVEDAEKLADAAIVYKNVGDGIEDISTASESIIATMQAFNDEISPDDVMLIVDKFNEVGNSFAISSVGIGEALLRSSAAMSAANNTLDETIALATAANTVVQNPDVVGTSLKTISMYLRAAKTEAEEAGESTEGMANSVSELRGELLALTGQKVDIMDGDSYKSTYQILKEISAVWETLSETTQANITEMIGGKRNGNVISALLENFSVAEEALATSADSAGSALAENEKHLNSIEGKISQLKATFEDFANSVIDSGLVKFIVDAGSGILNTLTKIIDALGAVPALLAGISTAMSFKNIGRDKMFSLFYGFNLPIVIEFSWIQEFRYNA